MTGLAGQDNAIACRVLPKAEAEVESMADCT